MRKISFIILILTASITWSQEHRGRIRDYGIHIGVLKPGTNNAITDVKGVMVGHRTLISGENIRTGVTAVLPHRGNIFRDKVPAAIHVVNGFGKLMGSTQVNELGNIETPILLTNTLNTPIVGDAVIDYMINLEGNQKIYSVNPVVGETNDSYLNEIRQRPVTKKDVIEAIKNAGTGPVAEGSVGAGTATHCLGFKGGIGTSSRILPRSKGGYTVGVLVQTNFGGSLTINGAPVGRELNRFYKFPYTSEGSCMIVVATDAPLSHRNLKRLAKRVPHAIGRVGGTSSNGSGDYVIAFSTHPKNRIKYSPSNTVSEISDLHNDAMSPLFVAVQEATEEAILNSMFRATTITGRGGRCLEALPIEKTITILKKYNTLNWDRTLPPGKSR